MDYQSLQTEAKDEKAMLLFAAKTIIIMVPGPEIISDGFVPHMAPITHDWPFTNSPKQQSSHSKNNAKIPSVKGPRDIGILRSSVKISSESLTLFLQNF